MYMVLDRVDKSLIKKVAEATGVKRVYYDTMDLEITGVNCETIYEPYLYSVILNEESPSSYLYLVSTKANRKSQIVGLGGM